ncbi:MAG: putative toxin-antitoxin system toxin component, PIN family [Chloroflexota bacterium]
MTKRLRAVFDTNVFLSAALSKNSNSPTKELLARWEREEFVLLICEALSDEITEKLIERAAPPLVAAQQIAVLKQLAEWVEVPSESIVRVLADPDDDVVLACATIGKADYIITYDPHFDSLGGEYLGIKILKAIPFLQILREQQNQD